MPAKPITVPMPILRLATGTLALALLPVPLAAQEEGVATAPQTHWTATGAIGDGAGPVEQSLLEAAPTRESWLHYGGNYGSWRHSPITELTPESASRLRLAWIAQTGVSGQLESSPVVYDGVLYLTSSMNRLLAYDAGDGSLLWRYDHQNPSDLRICCGPVNRGVGISGDVVVMGTLDARLLAFNRKSGELLWNTEVEPYASGFSITSAPLIAEGVAVIGIGGGEYGVRGFFDGYDVETGNRLWRHYTVPDDGEPGVETWAGDSYKTGGAPTWATGSYDPATRTLFWTTGNPSPDWNGDTREGDNLYSDSVLAVDIATGERKWHFQFTPHDVWDYDGNSEVWLVDVQVNEQTIPALVQANRNGYFYVLDRRDGGFLHANQYVHQLNWATLDENGRPVVNPAMMPADEPTQRVCPGPCRRQQRGLCRRLQPGHGSGLRADDRELHDVPQGPRRLRRGHPLLRRRTDSVRHRRRQVLRPPVGHRREHRRDPLELPGSDTDARRRAQHRRRSRRHRQRQRSPARFQRRDRRRGVALPDRLRHPQPSDRLPARWADLLGRRLGRRRHRPDDGRHRSVPAGGQRPAGLRTRSVTRPAPLAGVLSILLWAVVPAQAEDLRVCLLEDDLPRADRADASGFDHDLFREAAQRLGRDFVPVWRPNAPPYSEIDDTDLPLDDLVAGDCDLVPSVPGELALGRLRTALDLTPPYYAASLRDLHARRGEP